MRPMRAFLITVAFATFAFGQEERAERRRIVKPASPAVESELSATALPATATHIVSVVRCKVVDTENADGPRLEAGVPRAFAIADGPCDVPAALGYALTFTAIGSDETTVELKAWPSGGAQPASPTVRLSRGTAQNAAASSPQSAAVQPSADGAIDVVASAGTHLIIEITAYYTARPATPTGTPMTRWGNATAPAGTTLLYSGLTFGSYVGHGGRESICVKNGDPGPAAPQYELLYQSGTQGGLPPGIVTQKVIKCAVFLPSAAAVVVWGSWNGPTNWTELYRGYVMGPHYQHQGGSSRRHCVDSVNFDDSIADTFGGDMWFSTSILVAPPNSGYALNSAVKCSVWMKSP